MKCVGLTKAPEGEWICQWCKQEKDKELKAEVPAAPNGIPANADGGGGGRGSKDDDDDDEESWTQHGRRKRRAKM